MVSRVAFATSLLGLILFGSHSRAAVIASDNFESQTVGTISGQGGGTGFTGTYASDNASAVNIATQSLSYSNGSVVSSGGNQSLQISNNAASAGVDNSPLSRSIAAPPTSLTPVYFSYLLNANDVANNEFLQVGVGNASGTSSVPAAAIGLAQQTAGSLNFFLRMPNGGGSQFSTMACNANQTYLLVGELFNNSGATGLITVAGLLLSRRFRPSGKVRHL